MPRLLPLLLLVALAACQRTPATPRVAPARDSTLALTGISYNHKTGVVEGRIENRTASVYDSLAVRLTLLSQYEDSLAAIALDTLSLGPGETWHFTRVPDVAVRDSVGLVRVVRYAGTRRDNGERTDAELNRDVPTPRLTFGRR